MRLSWSPWWLHYVSCALLAVIAVSQGEYNPLDSTALLVAYIVCLGLPAVLLLRSGLLKADAIRPDPWAWVRALAILAVLFLAILASVGIVGKRDATLYGIGMAAWLASSGAAGQAVAATLARLMGPGAARASAAVAFGLGCAVLELDLFLPIVAWNTRDYWAFGIAAPLFATAVGASLVAGWRASRTNRTAQA